MFLLCFLLAGLAIGLLRGGSLRGLAGIQLRHTWLILVGLLLQVIAFSDFFAELPEHDAAARALYVLSNAVVIGGLCLNLHLPPLRLLLAGAVANTTAIVANGGYMPASPDALRAAGMLRQLEGMTAAGHLNNSLLGGNQTHLPLLTDIFAIPAGLPLANVFSIGDVLIGLGAMWLVAQAMVDSGETPPSTIVHY